MEKVGQFIVAKEVDASLTSVFQTSERIEQEANPISSKFKAVSLEAEKSSVPPVSSFNDTVECIILSCESRQGLQNKSSSIFEKGNAEVTTGGNTKNSGCFGGSLTESEINRLTVLCTSNDAITSTYTTPITTPLSHTGRTYSTSTGLTKGLNNPQSYELQSGWGSVEIENLVSLTAFLQDHVLSAACVDLIGAARTIWEENDNDYQSSNMEQWLLLRNQGKPNGYHRFCILKQGLEAASILLSIITSPGVNRRVASDDDIEACISLMRHHIHRNIHKALSNTGHILSLSSSKVSTSRPIQQAYDENGNSKILGPPSEKKRKPINSNSIKDREQNIIRWMKKVYKLILSTVGLLSRLVECVERLIQTINVDDQVILTICPTALDSLTINPTSSIHGNTSALTHIIQVSCIGLLSTIFRQYPRHRDVILQDLIPLFRKVPSFKKSIRTFPVCVPLKNNDTHPIPDKNRRQSIICNDQTETHIQMISALILFLVQGCVTMPKLNENKNSEVKKGAPKQAHLSSLKTTGLDDCERSCTYLIALLISNCSKKGEDGGASEYRPVLTNFVQDLLHVQHMIEFPAAEMILLSICRKLSHDLLSNSSINGKKRGDTIPAESTFLSTAMDTLGLICQSIAWQLSYCRENPFLLPSIKPDINLDKDSSTDCDNGDECICGRALMDAFMLDCDSCHKWFHGSCVGIAKDCVPEHWICESCKMSQLVVQQILFLKKTCRRPSLFDAEIVRDDQTQIMRLLFLQFLSTTVMKTKSSNLIVARHFLMAKWINESQEKEIDDVSDNSIKSVLDSDSDKGVNIDPIFTYFLDSWYLENESKNSRNQNEQLSIEGISKLIMELYVTNSKLVSSFPRLLSVILSLMEDNENTSLRKLAVRAISHVVQVDSALMSQPAIRNAVAKRFQDDAISVREASVSLVGIFLSCEQNLVNVFHNLLLARLLDNGISVRKRVVKILSEQMISNKKYSGLASASTVLLQRADDPREDDSVRDIIYETFQKLWFSDDRKSKIVMRTSKRESIIQSIDGEVSNENSVVITPLSSEKYQTKTKAFASGPLATAKQMVEVLMISRCPDYLTALVKEILFGYCEGDKVNKAAERRKRQIQTQKHCALIVSCLIEELLSFEECRNTSNSPSTTGLHLVALISTLGIFAKASPVLLMNDLDTLLPYLKADNGVSREYEAEIVLNVSNTISQVAPFFNKALLRKMCQGTKIVDDLVKITYNFGSVAMNAAVEALSKLAAHGDTDDKNPQRKRLLKLASTFCVYLNQMKDSTDDFSKVKAGIRNNVHRALTCLGSICRFQDKDNTESTNTENDDIEFLTTINVEGLHWNNLALSSFALFEEYLGKEDILTKTKALRAMAGIFIAHPRILLAVEQNGILDDVMSEKSHPQVQLETLICWREILESEELRIESGEAKRKMESKENITLSQKISGDQDGDASLIGACCTQHSQRLFEMALHVCEKIRLHSLHLIEILLRQGLINPMDTVPHLLALQGDIKHPAIRSLALKLLIQEGTKRPDMLKQRISAGIYQSFNFQRTVYPDHIRITALLSSKGSECIFGQIFKDTIRSSRQQSLKILRSLLGLFVFSKNEEIEPKEREKKNEPKGKESRIKQLPMLCFAAEMIAHLPYNHLGDVLFIVHHISSIISLEGVSLVYRLVDFLKPHGLVSKESVETDRKIKDSLEKKSQTKANLAVMNKKNFNVAKFAELCAEASSLVLLLRLKSFLCDAYCGITVTRLREYMPNEKEKIKDRGISQPSDMTRFNSVIHNSKENSKDSFDPKLLIHQYIEFRNTMRVNEEFMDTIDEVQEMSDNSLNDLPEPIVSKKRKKRNSL